MLHTFLAFLVQGDPSAPQGAGAAPGGPGGQPPPPSIGDSLTSMAVPMLLCVVVFWVFMIGPERKQRKKREEMLKAIKKGDEVLTNSGMYGNVVQVQDSVVTLQVAEGVRMKFALSAIGSVIDENAAATAKS
ncbi:MAG: preprotein translocase subunit YajC [Planctomycetes bacterium]|nr:preprotein translocase subunit YajC [Planctomycetota bacterium]